MYKVTVTLKSGEVSTFKSNHRCDNIKIESVYFGALQTSLREANPKALLHEHVGATLVHEPLDGRTHAAKGLKYYTVRYLF